MPPASLSTLAVMRPGPSTAKKRPMFLHQARRGAGAALSVTSVSAGTLHLRIGLDRSRRLARDAVERPGWLRQDKVAQRALALEHAGAVREEDLVDERHVVRPPAHLGQGVGHLVLRPELDAVGRHEAARRVVGILE